MGETTLDLEEDTEEFGGERKPGAISVTRKRRDGGRSKRRQEWRVEELPHGAVRQVVKRGGGKHSVERTWEKRVEARVSRAIEKKPLWRVERVLASGWLPDCASGVKAGKCPASGKVRVRDPKKAPRRQKTAVQKMQMGSSWRSPCFTAVHWPNRYNCAGSKKDKKTKSNRLRHAPRCSGSRGYENTELSRRNTQNGRSVKLVP